MHPRFASLHRGMMVVVVAAFIVVLLSQAAYALRFSDVPPTHVAYDAIEALASRGIVSGAGDGTFRPDGPLTRGQAAKILVRWRGITPTPSPAVSFPDLDNTYLSYVGAAAAQGWISGYPNGTFKPYQPLTREQMAIVTIRCLDKESDATGLSAERVRTVLRVLGDAGSISTPARPYVALALDLGLFSGDDQGDFSPTDPITRAQFCMVLQRAEVLMASGVDPGAVPDRGALADFMDTYLFGPRGSPITGEMVLQNTEWYGIPPIAQLVILAAETSLGDPKWGGELARHNNFGCLRYHGADTAWGELADGKIWVAGSDWYSFPTASIGMMAFGRYLKAGMDGFYVECLTSNPPDWDRFASVYYGENVPGLEQYVGRLANFEEKFRTMAAERGLTL